MANLTGFSVVWRPFGVLPATLQYMPDGMLDAGFGRFFLGVRVGNGGTTPWPATQARLSPRCRQILTTAGFVIEDSWSSTDAAAFGQQTSGEWVSVPAMAAGTEYTIFFKVDATKAHPGAHHVELELRDPTAPTVTVKAGAPLSVVRTTFDARSGCFASQADRGTLTAWLVSAAFDVEAFRQAVGRIRTQFSDGSLLTQSVQSGVDYLRTRLQGFLCGENQDICKILDEASSFCALPPNPPLPGPAGRGSYAVFSGQTMNLSDRVQVTAGSIGSNNALTIGANALLAGSAICGGDATLRENATVNGDVICGGFVHQNGTTVKGAIREHATYLPFQIPTKIVTPGTQDINVTNTATPVTLQPGTYNALQVSPRCKLRLSGGVYHFRRVNLDADAILEVDAAAGAIDVRALEQMAVGDRTIFQTVNGSSTPRIELYLQGLNELRVGTDITIFPASICAPQATIHVYSRTNVRGYLWGSTVLVEPDVTVTYSGAGDWVGLGDPGLGLFAYPRSVEYTVENPSGFWGTGAPCPNFDGNDWAVLLANINIMFSLLASGGLSAEVARVAKQMIIGKVKTAVLNAASTAPGSSPPSTQAGSVDAAVATFNGSRALSSPIFQLLDAQPNEGNNAPLGQDGRIALPGTYLTNAELDALISAAGTDPDGVRVFKSGAVTGVTRGIIAGVIPVFSRPDETGTVYFVNQLSIVPDPNHPSTDDAVAGPGDSGALWVHARTSKLVGLSHATGSNGAIASRIQDVIQALGIQFA